MRRWRMAGWVLIAGLAAGPGPAPAQPSPLVGTWSYGETGTIQGAGFSILFQFGPDGSFRQRLVSPGSTVDYVGRYQLGKGTLQLLYDDYEPKQDCRYGACYPIPPVVQLGQPYTDRIEFEGATRFLLYEGYGPKLFVRN